jgi:S1-C subfamily serine protease
VLDRGHGSGVHLGGGLWLTAAHVVADPSKRLDLQFKDGSIRKAEVLWASKERDIALLRADGAGVHSANLKCSVPEIGDDITMAGNPVALDNIIAFGKVAGDRRSMGHWTSVFIISGPVIPGQSGGAVYDKDHNLIGISVGLMLFPVGFSGSATGYGFAVDGQTICTLLARAA